MKYAAEWMTYEGRAERAPQRVPAPKQHGPALFVRGPWAYRAGAGLTPRREGESEGGVLQPEIAALFDRLWLSDRLPRAEHVDALVRTKSVSRWEVVAVEVPRYWRRRVEILELSLYDGSQQLFTVETRFFVEAGAANYLVELREGAPAAAPQLEAPGPVLLYDISDGPADPDGRRPLFVECEVDGGAATLHWELAGPLAGLPRNEPDPGARRVTFASMQLALAAARVDLERVALVARRSESLGLKAILEHEARLRNVKLERVEVGEAGLSFAGARSSFEQVNTFEDLRDILRWHTGGF